MAQSQPFDVVIVGSGAGGGMSAYSLTRAGLKVLMLEAGRHYDPLTETPMFHIPAEAPCFSGPENFLNFFRRKWAARVG